MVVFWGPCIDIDIGREIPLRKILKNININFVLLNTNTIQKMDRKRKANTLGDNEVDGGGTGGGALLDTNGDTEQQIQIIPVLIPHILSYCNDDTLKRCACASRSWYTMVKMRLWNDVSESLLSHLSGKAKIYLCCYKVYILCMHLNSALFL